MRAYFPNYEMHTPKNLRETLDVLKSEPGQWRPFAGGTDLMVVFETGQLKAGRFLNIWNLTELKNILDEKEFVTLGALVTYAQIQSSKIMNQMFPLLCRAAKETGAIAIQNRGTLGGNIANASPAADSPPALLVYEASLELTSSEGSRWVSYDKFHTSYKKMDLKPNELITRIRLPKYQGSLKHYYRKVGTRKAQAISKVCFAGIMSTNKKIGIIRLGMGSVAPIPLRCKTTEDFLRGKILTKDLIKQARLLFQKEITPIDDIRSTSTYRNAVAANLLEEFLCGTGSVS